jgi:hypothetical protein
MNKLHILHSRPHGIQDSDIVKEQNRFFALQAITIMLVSASKIVTWTAPNHQVKAAKSINV